MTQAPVFANEIPIELSDEEHEMLTSRAQSIGISLEGYLRVRMLTSEVLPEPAAFFDLFRRLAAFAKDYERCIQAIAAPPYDRDLIKDLGEVFAQLIQDWEALYGPSPDDELLPELLEPILDLPPRTEAEAQQRAAQEAQAKALFADLKLPPGTDRAAVRKIVNKHNELVRAHNERFEERARTGAFDRRKVTQLLADMREARREYLIAIGQDPDSADLLSFTAFLHDT